MIRRTLLIIVVLATSVAWGFGDVASGNRHYRAGRYAEAVAAYEKALADGTDTPELRYNLGTALLALNRMADAEQHFRRAVATGETDVRQRAYYNLGNRYLIDARATTDGAQRAPLLEQAVESYKRALRLNPDDADAKWNLELALREEEKQQQPSGGGGDENDAEGDDGAPEGGGAAGDDPSQDSGDDPQQGQGGGQAGMSQQQAERILKAAEQDERDLYRAKLRRGRRSVPVARDW